MTLPAFLSSSYQQYKEDQKVFTTWLYQAAKACGYKSATDTAREAALKAPKVASEVITAPSQRLKGKARKAAKQAGPSNNGGTTPKPSRSVSYMMSTAELIARVRAVVQSPVRQVLPAGIRAVLKRAINARKRCADWYAQSGADVTANEGHRHFIDILTDAFKSLSPASTNGQGAAETESKEILDISNKFEALEVEDVDEEFPLTAADVSAPSKKVAEPRETYDVDDSDMEEFDATFQLFCFFEDLHAIQADIQGVWRRFARGELDLKVAMIVTQVGFDVVKRLEKEQGGRAKSCAHHGSKHPHINLLLPVYYEEAYRNGEDADELLYTPKGLEHRGFDDFVYLPTLRTLMKFADVAHKCKDKVAWPFPVPQMRFSYICRPDLLERPGYKEREEDDRVLTQLLLDTFFIDDSKQMMKKQFRGSEQAQAALPILQDEFSDSARTVWQTGTVDTYAVFTSTVVLDILDICGHATQPSFARHLRDECQRASATMEFFVDDSGIMDTREVRWLRKDQQLIMDLHQLIEVHIPNTAFPYFKDSFLKMHSENKQPGHSGSLKDMPPEMQAAFRQRMIERGLDPDEGPTEEHNRNAEKLNLHFIEPSPQADFLQSHNALHCGSLSLRLTSFLEEAGIALANHHLSIFATAHLYNALHQLGMTEIKWPDMERVIDLHTDALFANDVPKTAADCYKRIAYRTGYRAASKTFNTKQPWKFRTGAASASLRQLLDSKDSVEHALLQLEIQLDEHATPQNISKSKSNNNKSGRKRQLTPEQLMARFQQYLPIVLKDMELNYITLTKTCNALIKSIRTTLDSELGMHVPSSRGVGESNDHSVVTTILLVLEQNQKKATVHEMKKDKSPFKGSIELQTACKAFETFFNTHLARQIASTTS